jgi:hypothetical protein
MRRSWQLVTLVGGLLLLVVAFTMIAAITPPTPPYAEEGVSGESPHSVVREYYNRALAVRLYYPNTWQRAEMETGVRIQPAAPSADFVEQGAVFALWQSTATDDASTLSPLIQTLLESTDDPRASENVAVGGVSGTETVIEVEADAVSASPLNAQLTSALRAANSHRVTVVLWVSNEADHPYTVLMADARDGNHLSTLQQIRNSIQWE